MSSPELATRRFPAGVGRTWCTSLKHGRLMWLVCSKPGSENVMTSVCVQA
jgi:hypothetical protein